LKCSCEESATELSTLALSDILGSILGSAGGSGASAVPITPLLKAEVGAFGPEEVASITNAFEMILRSLGLVNREDPVVLLVAKTTLEIAKDGECDPMRLSELVIKRMAN
jgi:hypothetical protein